LAIDFYIYIAALIEVFIVLRVFKPGVPGTVIVVAGDTDIVVDVMTASTFINDFAFDFIIARVQITKIVISTGAFAPLIRIRCFFADESVVYIKFHIGDVLVFMCFHPYVDVFTR
jgi:hypothetical protein